MRLDLPLTQTDRLRMQLRRAGACIIGSASSGVCSQSTDGIPTMGTPAWPGARATDLREEQLRPWESVGDRKSKQRFKQWGNKAAKKMK